MADNQPVTTQQQQQPDLEMSDANNASLQPPASPTETHPPLPPATSQKRPRDTGFDDEEDAGPPRKKAEGDGGKNQDVVFAPSPQQQEGLPATDNTTKDEAKDNIDVIGAQANEEVKDEDEDDVDVMKDGNWAILTMASERSKIVQLKKGA